MIRPLRVHALLVLCALACVACDERELVSGLNLKQSTEVLVGLSQAGISADRAEQTSGRSTIYSVRVANGDFDRALSLLHALNLPREDGRQLDELLEPRGFVPNPRELNELRLDRARALEIERALQSFPGVVDANVIVRAAHLESGQKDARAWVHVRTTQPQGTPRIDEEGLRQTIASAVSSAVPEITADRIDVETSAVSVPVVEGNSLPVAELGRMVPFGFHVPERERVGAQRQLGIVILMSALCAAIVGLYIGWWMGQRRRRTPVSNLPARTNGESFFQEGAEVAQR